MYEKPIAPVSQSFGQDIDPLHVGDETRRFSRRKRLGPNPLDKRKNEE